MRFLGRTGEISALMKNMRDVPPEERPSMGKLLNALRQWTDGKPFSRFRIFLSEKGFYKRLSRSQPLKFL